MYMTVPTCLVIEDSEIDRQIMHRVLMRQTIPLRTIFVHSLTEARRTLSEEDVSIIFLDNALPDGKGADFLTELSAYTTLRDVPVILVSDWPSPFMFAKAKAQNVLAIWSKKDFTVDRVHKVIAPLKRSA